MLHAPPPPAGDQAALAFRELDGFPSPERFLGLKMPFCLLESGTEPGRFSRWILLGLAPRARFLSRDGVNVLIPCKTSDARSVELIRRWREEPLPALRRALAAFPPVRNEGAFPFAGGAMGYFSYELGRRLLPLRPCARDDLGLPDIAMVFYEGCLIWDRLEDRLGLVAYARAASRAQAAKAAESKAARLEQEVLVQMEIAPEVPVAAAREESRAAKARAEPLSVVSSLPGPAYRRAVARCREEILDGNAYELCLTTRFETSFAGDAAALYAALRRSNPAPFAACLRHPELTLVGSSPERFLSVDRAGLVEARPIKGTRPRGRDGEEDARMRRDLTESAKDRAENIMIVDLMRNDLSRVCVPGSVSAPEICVLEEYAAVMQLVSSVRGRLAPGRDRLDLLDAGFPGGSMTGAPKIAAMNLLEEMEPLVRGCYSGALGYLGFDGAMDLSIVIRSVQLLGARALVGAGGAVVHDSDPEAEWQEALHKAAAPLAAVAAAQGREGFTLEDPRTPKRPGAA